MRIALLALLLGLTAIPAGAEPYTTGPASRDGIGKFYMGREISHVMGHLGAGWLERPEREREERTDLVVENMDLAPDATVADIGAGTGYFSLRIAEAVPDGKVIAVDIQPEMLAMVETRAAAEGFRNVHSRRGEIDDPRLEPASVDAALIVDAYHEFSHPVEMLAGIYTGLKPGGRLYLLEYRLEDPRVPIKRLHKMSEAQARKEVEAAGLRWIETADFLPQQHFLVFEKPAEAPATAE
ncbi:MAG: class I SAM-dependent methyltransferase [Pseudomonadota bacterium]